MPVICCVLGEELSSCVETPLRGLNTEAFGRNASGGTQHRLGAWVWHFSVHLIASCLCITHPFSPDLFLGLSCSAPSCVGQRKPQALSESLRAQVCTWYLMESLGIYLFLFGLLRGCFFDSEDGAYFTFCCPFRGQIVLRVFVGHWQFWEVTQVISFTSKGSNGEGLPYFPGISILLIVKWRKIHVQIFF